MIGTILEMLGHEVDEDTLKEIIAEVDVNGNFFIFIYFRSKFEE